MLKGGSIITRFFAIFAISSSFPGSARVFSKTDSRNDFSFIDKITVITGKISWGGTSYDCEITSVKKSADTEFADISAEQRGTSYEFDGFGHGVGAVGFICEAKTADNEQKRNGQTLSFNASAIVKPAGNAAEYRIESNTVTGSQQCVYTHTTQLPYTGDDTNMPVLIGLFSLFIICGGASSFVLLRRKKTGTDQRTGD